MISIDFLSLSLSHLTLDRLDPFGASGSVVIRSCGQLRSAEDEQRSRERFRRSRTRSTSRRRTRKLSDRVLSWPATTAGHAWCLGEISKKTVTKRGQFMRWLWRFFGFYLSPGVVTRYVKDCQSRFKISNARKMGTWKTKWQIQYLLNIP